MNAPEESLKDVEARVIQDWRWGYLTILGVANHLMRGGFNSRTAVAKANELIEKQSLPLPGDRMLAIVAHLRTRADGFRAAAKKQGKRVGPMAKGFDWAALEIESTFATPSALSGNIDDLLNDAYVRGWDDHRGDMKFAPGWEAALAEFRKHPSYPYRPSALSGDAGVVETIRQQIINAPETADFMAGVPIEAAHQRERWGASHDAGKTPFDWFWLVGYLAQKAASSAVAGDTEKALHHTISTAAALANWHAALAGIDTAMRPGIDPAALPSHKGAGE